MVYSFDKIFQYFVGRSKLFLALFDCFASAYELTELSLACNNSASLRFNDWIKIRLQFNCDWISLSFFEKSCDADLFYMNKLN